MRLTQSENSAFVRLQSKNHRSLSTRPFARYQFSTFINIFVDNLKQKLTHAITDPIVVCHELRSANLCSRTRSSDLRLLMDNFIWPRSWDGQHMLNHCDLWGTTYNINWCRMKCPSEVCFNRKQGFCLSFSWQCRGAYKDRRDSAPGLDHFQRKSLESVST